MGKFGIKKMKHVEKNTKYTETHEWIAVEEDVGTVGVTDIAQRELGEVVYVELPAIGMQVQAGQEVAVLESTKAATDIYAPVSGEILQVNAKLKEESSLVNRNAEREGWLFQIKLKDQNELKRLMTKKAYLDSLDLLRN